MAKHRRPQTITRGGVFESSFLRDVVNIQAEKPIRKNNFEVIRKSFDDILLELGLTIRIHQTINQGFGRSSIDKGCNCRQKEESFEGLHRFVSFF
jgi:hypothetical protein